MRRPREPAFAVTRARDATHSIRRPYRGVARSRNRTLANIPNRSTTTQYRTITRVVHREPVREHARAPACRAATLFPGSTASATLFATISAMFPAHVRYAGMAIAYNVSTSLFGGTAPIVNDWLIGKTGNTMIPAYYMMAACAIGLVALADVIETRGCSLRGETVLGQPG